jgi:hypothetical protein
LAHKKELVTDKYRDSKFSLVHLKIYKDLVFETLWSVHNTIQGVSPEAA